MNMKKTYYVNGLVEWTAALRAGRAVIKVPFSGGAFTKYGHHPARFTTSNPTIQEIIERSPHFKSGKIYTL